MKCESCTTKEASKEEKYGNQNSAYHLCLACRQRLLNKALRPLEFFNLVAIHGHGYYLGHYLHDDFYDFETGEATQPGIEVTEAEKYPFPKLNIIKIDLERLVDFACVQYETTENVARLLRQHDANAILDYLVRKTQYNRAINYKTYEIAAKVLGSAASVWIQKEWSNRKENEIMIFAQALAECLPFDTAFEMLTSEIEKESETGLNNNIPAMLYFKSNRTLDWLEHISGRIKNISGNWGVLAAASHFSWARAEKWLSLGRPLSLIALDAIGFCTTIGDRQNQALWLQRNPPTLLEAPVPAIMAKTVLEYLAKDNVPRTKAIVNRIIANVLPTD